MIRARRMFWVIAYDIADDKRRGKVVKVLEKYGERVNLSVFECMFTSVQLEKVKKTIAQQIHPVEDSVIYYPLCVECFSKIIRQNKSPGRPETVYLV